MNPNCLSNMLEKKNKLNISVYITDGLIDCVCDWSKSIHDICLNKNKLVFEQWAETKGFLSFLRACLNKWIIYSLYPVSYMVVMYVHCITSQKQWQNVLWLPYWGGLSQTVAMRSSYRDKSSLHLQRNGLCVLIYHPSEYMCVSPQCKPSYCTPSITIVIILSTTNLNC